MAHCPAYGITLTNPDSDRWALNVLQEGAMQMILLEDKLSVKQEGIGVAVIDLLMAYGADIVNLFKDETTAKEYLKGSSARPKRESNTGCFSTCRM